MWSRPLALALLLLAAPALAGVKENVAALAPAGLVFVIDAKGNELVAQNADEPFVPASVTKIVTAWLAMEASTSRVLALRKMAPVCVYAPGPARRTVPPPGRGPWGWVRTAPPPLSGSEAAR